MKVFFDNCTSPILAETLNGFLVHSKGSAAHIRDLPCGRSASDVEWMAFLADDVDEWIVITGDRHIQRNRAERLAFRQAALRGFVFAPAYQKTPVHQQASLLIWRWPDVESLVKLTAAPFLFELPVSRSGKIRSLSV